jgi:hypothetical protein
MEPGGGTSVGAVESLLTSSCFPKGGVRGAIIAYLVERARWDAGLVPCGPSQPGVG